MLLFMALPLFSHLTHWIGYRKIVNSPKATSSRSAEGTGTLCDKPGSVILSQTRVLIPLTVLWSIFSGAKHENLSPKGLAMIYKPTEKMVITYQPIHDSHSGWPFLIQLILAATSPGIGNRNIIASGFESMRRADARWIAVTAAIYAKAHMPLERSKLKLAIATAHVQSSILSLIRCDPASPLNSRLDLLCSGQALMHCKLSNALMVVYCMFEDSPDLTGDVKTTEHNYFETGGFADIWRGEWTSRQEKVRLL